MPYGVIFCLTQSFLSLFERSEGKYTITSALPKYNVSSLHITFSHKAKNIT